MEDGSGFILGNKEYTNAELIVAGKAHYPKRYWIKRGIGLGLLFIALMCFIPLIITINRDPSMYPGGEDYLTTYKIVLTIVTLSFFLPGIILFIVSFFPEKDEVYKEYGKRWLTKSFDKSAKREFDRLEQLKRYKQLLDAGVISQDEFDQKKKEFLD